MPLPYASDSVPDTRPTATLCLLALNVVLTGGVILGDWQGWWRGLDVLARFGIVPGEFRPYTVLTYSFFHTGVAHLLLNVCYLWLFGAGVESAVGPWRFLALYLVTGAVGGGLQTAVTLRLLAPADAMSPIVGASAACAGLIGIYAVRYYRARLSFVLVPFRPHVVTVVGVFLVYEIGSGLWGLFHGGEEVSVAHWAHIGGFILGLSCAQWLRLSEVGQRAYLAADATQAMHKSMPGTAIDRWEQMLAREPQNAHARAELARAWFLFGDRDQAREQYLSGVTTHLGRNERLQAAQLYAEILEHELEPVPLTPWQLYTIGSALEEIERFAPAADALQRVTNGYPDAPEAENALLKLMSLYVHRLNRREAAWDLLRIHSRLYPHSQWRGLAEDLRRTLGG